MVFHYKAEAHEAADAVEHQGGLQECLHPANNIVREFLLCAPPLSPAAPPGPSLRFVAPAP